MSTNTQPTIRNEVQSWRILAFAGVVAVVFAVFIMRLFVLQVVQAEEWTAKAEENSTEEINLAALRGLIYDRNGVVLSQNVASYNVVITAANLPDDDGSIQEIFRQLSQLIGIP